MPQLRFLSTLKFQVVGLAGVSTLSSGLLCAGLLASGRAADWPWQVWGAIAATTGVSVCVATLLMRRVQRSVDLLRRRIARLFDQGLSADADWPVTRGELGEVEEAIRAVAVTRQRSEQQQMQLIDQMQAILHNASVGILFTREGRFELMGEHFRDMFGYQAHELVGQLVRKIYPSDEAYAELGARVRAAFAKEGFFDGELQFLRKDGSLFWAHMLGRGVIPNDPSGGTIWIIEDITESRAAREALSWSATHDSLTELVNRREFENRLERALQQNDPGKVCVMFIDLDRFKLINDNAGHAAGDQALQAVARLLVAAVRLSDTVARLGGDEFAVLLPGCPLDRARQLAENMRTAIDRWRLDYNGQQFTLGASFGIARGSADLRGASALMNAADTACYQAKHGGRNLVVTYQAPERMPQAG